MFTIYSGDVENRLNRESMEEGRRDGDLGSNPGQADGASE